MSRALHKLARNVYRQLGRLATEHARLLAAETTDIRDRITVIGDDHVAQARRQGKGVILVTGHFGYWELLVASVAALGYPMAVVAKDQHNPAVNALIIKGREKLGMKVISMAAATHAIMRALRRNECVGLLMDQDAGPGGTFVDFLGLEASTYQGPALFALRSGAPIIPCFIIREGAERHRALGRRISDAHRGFMVLRRNLDGRVPRAGSRAANQQRQLEFLPLHLLRDIHHLVQRRRYESAEPDDVRLLVARGAQDSFSRYHDPQFDNLVVVALQHDRDDVLADVVNVALDGRHYDYAA
jgi:hypothetical protein